MSIPYALVVPNRRTGVRVGRRRGQGDPGTRVFTAQETKQSRVHRM